jgi:hypothetical protein
MRLCESKCGDDESVSALFTIHYDKAFAILLTSKRKAFTSISSNDALRFADCLADFQSVASELCMFFADVNPALIGQPNRHASFGNNCCSHA